MTKKRLSKLALICVLAAAGMFVVGSKNRRLTELKDFFWVPLPLAAIAAIGASRAKT